MWFEDFHFFIIWPSLILCANINACEKYKQRPPVWYCNYRTDHLCRKSCIGSFTVMDRVNYKIGLLVYKCLHGLAPGYLSDQCIPASTFAGRANMRSSSRLDRQLYVPRTIAKTLGPQGFYYASSAVWNSLPADLRDPGLSFHSFRTKLKSHFFTDDWFFSVVHSCTLLFLHFFSPCAPTWCLLAGVYKCLNWIENN